MIPFSIFYFFRLFVTQVYIWDLNNPHTPYGPRSSKMDHVRTVAWNGQVQHILSTASTNGFTTIWDLRNKKEIMILPQHSNPISSIAWHPDNVNMIIK
jgi:protein transport protein SEC31